jgi:hypothetical protein
MRLVLDLQARLRLHDLTFVPSAGRTHSVLLTAGCQWHGFVVNGDAA